jgi:hypothetical protein
MAKKSKSPTKRLTKPKRSVRKQPRKRKPKSVYDKLHDRFNPILTSKSGTRYERLAAMVWKILNQSNCVIHDVKLRGNAQEVKHQIDVSITDNGRKRRVLIECKDFDVAAKPVGLDIIRSFRSVIEDTGSPEGIVLTCEGYTKPARAYAKNKGIRLVILRRFTPADMKGRVGRAIITVTLSVNEIEDAQLAFDPGDHDAFAKALADVGMSKGDTSDLASPIIMESVGQSLHYNEFLSKLARTREVADDGQSHTQSLGLQGWSVRVGKSAPIPVKGVHLTLKNVTDSHSMEYAAQRTAELILQGFDDADLIVFGDQLQRCSIAKNGEVSFV